MLAPTCGLAFVDLLATRRALSWYLSLDFQFASAGVGALHARLAEPDLTGMKLHELLMPLPLRTRFNYTLYAGVLDMGTFDGWAWLKRALDELNAQICLVSALDVRVELGEAHTAQRRRVLIRAFDDSNRERVCEPVHPGDRRRVRPLAAAPEQLHVFSVDPIGPKLVDLATPQRFRRPASHDCASPCHVADETVSPHKVPTRRLKKRRVGAVPRPSRPSKENRRWDRLPFWADDAKNCVSSRHPLGGDETKLNIEIGPTECNFVAST